jgi:hypothetical protein
MVDDAAVDLLRRGVDVRRGPNGEAASGRIITSAAAGWSASDRMTKGSRLRDLSCQV